MWNVYLKPSKQHYPLEIRFQALPNFTIYESAIMTHIFHFIDYLSYTDEQKKDQNHENGIKMTVIYVIKNRFLYVLYNKAPIPSYCCKIYLPHSLKCSQKIKSFPVQLIAKSQEDFVRIQAHSLKFSFFKGDNLFPNSIRFLLFII